MDHTAELETPRILAGWQGRGRRLLFAALLAAGFLVWEATAMPAVAALVVCFKFGFGDWSLGVWLARHDPDRKRGLVCLLFHLAFGMWKVAVSATLLVFLSLFAGVIMARAGFGADFERGGGGCPGRLWPDPAHHLCGDCFRGVDAGADVAG